MLLSSKLTALLAGKFSPLSVQFETWAEQLPRDSVESVYTFFGGIDAEGGKVTIRRLLNDNFREVQVAYSLTLETNPRGHRLAIDEASVTGSLFPALPKKWTRVSPPDLPVPQVVQNGDVLKLELFTRPSGSKLVDYIRVGMPKVPSVREDAPHDAYAEDAEFTIARPTFRVNGVPMKSPVIADLHGPVLRIRVAEFGSYILSLKPHPDLGFQYAGEVFGSLLTFMMHGNVFRIDCTDRIASGSAVYNVYALRDTLEETTDAPGTSSLTISAEPSVWPAIGQ